MPAIVPAAATADVPATTAAMRGLVAAVEAFMPTLTIDTVKVVSMEALEVIAGLMVAAMRREAAAVSVPGIKIVVHGTVEAVVAMEPGSGSKEKAAVEPLGAVVAVRSAVVGSVAVVAVGAGGRGAADVNAEGNLSRRGCRDSETQTYRCNRCSKSLCKGTNVHDEHL